MSFSPEIMLELTGIDAAQDLRARLAEYIARLSKGTPSGYARFAVKIRQIDPLEWLESQEVIAKYYWRDREGKSERAGLLLPRFGLELPTATSGILRGCIEHAEGDNSIPAALSIRGFNSFPFVAGLHVSQPPIAPQYSFLLPDIELITVGGETWLTCLLQNTGEHEMLSLGLADLVWNENIAASSLRMAARDEAQSRLQWAIAVNRAVAGIARGDLEKVVLARKSTCRFESPVSPWKLLKLLRTANPHAYIFGLDRKPFDPFIGASPEQLYRRVGRLIETEAVAGTRPRGKTTSEDNRYRDDLLHSSKDRREHELVVTGIAESLRPLVEKIEIQTDPSIVQLTNVQHLVIKISATLKPGISDDEILRALQPTPAVGGYPKQVAIDLIQSLEPFYRGPYAGPIGWISSDSAEFAVGIRSATIKENALTLYAGAGIVEGSDPDAEWDEIDQKFNTFTSIFTDK